MPSLLGLLLGLVLLVWLTVCGMELLVAAPLRALLVALTAAFVQAWFLMFLPGSLFRKVMEATGAADSVATWIVGRIGARYAMAAIVLACAVLTYGGVSLFRVENLPRRFIPATPAFGSVTFTMTSAGAVRRGLRRVPISLTAGR